jgi:VanZ family protein
MEAGAAALGLIPFAMLRAGAWFCIILPACLSLIPGDLQLRTGFSGLLEHLVAYLGTAMLFALGYSQRRLQAADALVAYAGFLEALQAYSPGRTPNPLDACASGTGAVLGVVAVTWLTGRYVRH